MSLNAYYQIGGDIGVSGNADTYSSPFSPAPLAYSNSPPPASNPPPPFSGFTCERLTSGELVCEIDPVPPASNSPSPVTNSDNNATLGIIVAILFAICAIIVGVYIYKHRGRTTPPPIIL